MRRKLFSFCIKLFITGLAFFLISSCTEEPAEVAAPSSPECLLPEAAESISTTAVKAEKPFRVFTFPGQISVNRDEAVRVYPAAGGVINRVHVRTGDFVEKGQVLAEVQSPNIAEFYKERRSARTEESIAKRNLELAEAMHESGIYSAQELMQARKALDEAEAEIKRLENVQAVYGISDEAGEEAVYRIKAPRSGFIIERNINQGAILSEEEGQIFEISDLNSVWVTADISESGIKYIRRGTAVSISTLAYPDLELKGEIIRLSQFVNPQNRTIEAIVELPNPEFLLKPGMYATIKAKIVEDIPELSVPGNSVIFDNNKYYSVVYKDECRIEIRDVLVSGFSGEQAFIRSGIQEGEQVVTDRQLLLYNTITSRTK